MILTREIVVKENLIDKNGHCTIPEGYTGIEECVFYDCKKLKSIELPVSLKRIDRFVFYGCINLKSIVLPDSVEEIEKYAFENCTNLISINISNLKNVRYCIFKNCTSLPKLGVGKEILEAALKDNYFEQFLGLCVCLNEIVRSLILKYRKPICLEVELPMFTVKNAIKYANGRDKCYWFKDSSDRGKFLEWMLSEIKKSNINDEILILRR